MVRFGAADPTSVDVIRFRPGEDTVEIGRIGSHLQLGMLGPILSGIDIGASVSAGGGDVISVPRPQPLEPSPRDWVTEPTKFALAGDVLDT